MPNGKRKYVSTHTTDRYDAMRLALSMEALGKNYTRNRALKLVEEIAGVAEDSIGLTVGEYFHAWLTRVKHGLAPTTYRQYEVSERMCRRKLGSIKLSVLEPRHIAEYRDLLLSEGKMPRTVQNRLSPIKVMLNDAVADGLIPDNPALKVKRPTAGPSSREAFTLEQFNKLLEVATGEWHLLILVAGLTGQRLSDCLRLRWDDIGSGVIRFRRAKNKDIHAVPIHQNLQEAICTPREGVLFPELSSWMGLDASKVSKGFKKIKESAGIKTPSLTFHSLRHMLSTELNRMGVSDITRMRLVGHQSARVSAGYTHTDLAMATEAINKVVLKSANSGATL